MVEWGVMGLRKTFFAASVLLLVLSTSLVFANVFGNSYAGTTIVVAPFTKTYQAVSFTARAAGQLNTVYLLVRKYGVGVKTYSVSLRSSSGGVPGSTLASGTVTVGDDAAEAPGRFWMPIVFTTPPTINSGSTYFVVLQLRADDEEDDRISLAYLGGTGQPNTNWPSDLSQGNLKVFTSPDGSSWVSEQGAPAFTLLYSDGSGDGNPYDTITSGRIYGNNWVSQEFTLSQPLSINSVIATVRKVGSGNPPGPLYAQVMDSVGNNVGEQLLLSGNALTDEYEVRSNFYGSNCGSPPCSITPLLLSAGNYQLVLKAPAATFTNFYRWLAFATNLQFSPFSEKTFQGTASKAKASATGGAPWLPYPYIDHSFSLDAQQAVCSDATPISSCNTANKPKYCNGALQLVDNSSFCGCPDGKWVTEPNTCVPILDNFTVSYFDSSAPTAVRQRTYFSGSSSVSDAVAMASSTDAPRVLKASPLYKEMVLASQEVDDVDDNLLVQVYGENSWGNSFTIIASAASRTTRAFDVEYEQSTGRALVVYRKGSSPATLFYRVWSGRAWSSESSVTGTGIVSIDWVGLTAKKNSQQIMALWHDTSGRLYASLWGGSSFGAVTALSTGVVCSYECFDFAFETLSGNGLAVFRETGDNKLAFRTYSSTLGTWGATTRGLNILGGDASIYADWVKLASNPLSNEIRVGVQNSAIGIDLKLWDGSTISSLISYAGIGKTRARRAFDMAYMSNGTLLVVYAQGEFHFSRSWLITGNDIVSPETISPTFAALSLPGPSAWVSLSANFSGKEIYAVISENVTNSLTAFKWTGSQWQGPQLIKTASSGDYESFAIAHNINFSARAPCPLGQDFDYGICVDSLRLMSTYFDNDAALNKTRVVNFSSSLSLLGQGDTTLPATPSSGIGADYNTSSKHVLKASPTKSEMILVTQDKSFQVVAQVYNGTTRTWGNNVTLSAQVFSNAVRSFDVAYEQLSGKAVVAYRSLGTGSPAPDVIKYRVWDGVSWGAETTTPGSNPVNNYWVQLVPKPGSNQIRLITYISANTLFTQTWSGSAWSGTWTNVATIDTSGTVQCTNFKCFDFAYESLSGEGLLAYRTYSGNVITGAANGNAVIYRTVDAAGTTWGTPTAAIIYFTTTTRANWVRLASNPASNEIMISSLDTASDIYTRMYSGLALAATTIMAETSVSAATTRPFDLAYVSPGRLLMVYGTLTIPTTQPRYATWLGSTWNSNLFVPDVAGTLAWVSLVASPDGKGAYALVSEKTGNDLWVLKWNGATWISSKKVDSDSYSLYEGFAIAARNDTCSDDTPINSCSSARPLYCNSARQLVSDFITCPCVLNDPTFTGSVPYANQVQSGSTCISIDEVVLASYYDSAAPTKAKYATFSNSNGWSPNETVLTTISSGDSYRVLRAAPTRNEAVLAMQSAKLITISIWNQTRWGNTTSMGSGYSAATRSFDVAYEQTSGKAFVAYSYYPGIGYNEIKCVIWNGSALSTSCPTFTTTISVSYLIDWVALYPKNNSNEITLLYHATDNQVYGAVWSGSAWSASKQLTTATTTAPCSYKCFDFAYETSSGDGLAVFKYGVGSINNIGYSTRTSGASSWSPTATSSSYLTATASQLPQIIRLAANPVATSNEIAVGILDTGDKVNMARWTGTDWSTATSYSIQSNAVPSGSLPAGSTRTFDLAYQSDGKLLTAYGASASSTPRYRLHSGSAWSSTENLMPALDGPVSWIGLTPRGNDVYAIAVENVTNGVWALKWDGTSWSAPQLLGRGSPTYESAVIAARRDT